MTEPDLSSDYALRTEAFHHGDFSATVVLPASSDELIDENEFDADERLPYWAELWPSAQALARVLLSDTELFGPALELGAGIGLPSLALLHRGIPVLTTDYYAEALRFARHNAAVNGLGPLATRHLDWRNRTEGLEQFPLVLAADVLYERRNADALEALLPGVVAPGGSFLLADPGRVYLNVFLTQMSAARWSIETLPERVEPSPAGKGLQVKVRLFRLRPPA
ncbi:MAG: methyltransferase type 12 [Gemmatimonadota bacterium]